MYSISSVLRARRFKLWQTIFGNLDGTFRQFTATMLGPTISWDQPQLVDGKPHRHCNPCLQLAWKDINKVANSKPGIKAGIDCAGVLGLAFADDFLGFRPRSLLSFKSYCDDLDVPPTPKPEPKKILWQENPAYPITFNVCP